eukprot:TRINITY_DN1373_c5_g1_i1.p1 TRINITY_DN1373_c5_g1~~TRINITY_DN1373_c5_g1_i1.p1  ORF type:complete len:160 (+),score=26.97 TRINITY_DN1373_c5_g1_i1:55-534(+)
MHITNFDSSVVTIRKNYVGEPLGLDIVRKAGGDLFVSSVVPGSAGARSRVPEKKKLVEVGGMRVYNVGSLQQALEHVKHLTTFDIVLGCTVDAEDIKVEKQLRLKSRRRSSSGGSTESTESCCTTPLLPNKWIDEFNPRNDTTLEYTPPSLASLYATSA